MHATGDVTPSVYRPTPSCDPSVVQAGVKRVLAAYHEQEQGRSEAWGSSIIGRPRLFSCRRRSSDEHHPGTLGQECVRRAGACNTLLLIFRLFVIMCGLDPHPFGNRSLPPISPASSLTPPCPVQCLSRHPHALSHGSFHASFDASFPLQLLRPELVMLFVKRLEACVNPVCSPGERAYQEYYSVHPAAQETPLARRVVGLRWLAQGAEASTTGNI